MHATMRQLVSPPCTPRTCFLQPMHGQQMPCKPARTTCMAGGHSRVMNPVFAMACTASPAKQMLASSIASGGLGTGLLHASSPHARVPGPCNMLRLHPHMTIPHASHGQMAHARFVTKSYSRSSTATLPSYTQPCFRYSPSGKACTIIPPGYNFNNSCLQPLFHKLQLTCYCCTFRNPAAPLPHPHGSHGNPFHGDPATHAPYHQQPPQHHQTPQHRRPAPGI